jgi:hypothetical protein
MNEILMWLNDGTREILFLLNGIAIGMWIGSMLQKHFDRKKGGE